jgi:hypothetical protein
MAPTTTQAEGLIELLRERGAEGVTPLLALEHIGTLRLAAVVYDLRAAGWDIRTEMVDTPNGKHVARYTLHEAVARGQIGLGLV